MRIPFIDHSTPNRFPSFWQRLIDYRWIVFNMLFALYLLFLQPLFLRRLSGVISRHHTDWSLAVLLMGVQALELLGMALKAPDLRRRLFLRSEAVPSQGWSFLIWIMHITLNVILLMTAMQAMGIPIAQAETDSTAQTALMIGFTLVILKELGVLFWWLDLDNAPTGTEIPPSPHPLQPVLADILLFTYSAVTFTSLWDWTAVNTPIQTSNIFLAGVEYIAASMLFFIAFIASRGLLLLEEITAIRNRQQTTFHIITIMINLLAALWFIPRI